MGVGTSSLAFYYPGHIWHDDDWIKNLLLFFDGVGLLVPEHKQDEVERVYPHIAPRLRERGLLHYFVANSAIDRRATEEMARPIISLIESGALDNLPDQRFHSMSFSRLGFYGDEEIAGEVYRRLREKDLAGDSEDGVSFKIRAPVRYLILSLLAQAMRGGLGNYELCPATDRPEIVDGLKALLGVEGTRPNIGSVVEFDLQRVGVDLSRYPIEDVLAFRDEHGSAYRQYARTVRSFAYQVSLLPPYERERMFEDRKAQLQDVASDLAKESQRAWKAPVLFALGLAGTAWAASQGDWIEASLIGTATAVTGWSGGGRATGDFSYLFQAQNSFS